MRTNVVDGFIFWLPEFRNPELVTTILYWLDGYDQIYTTRDITREIGSGFPVPLTFMTHMFHPVPKKLVNIQIPVNSAKCTPQCIKPTPLTRAATYNVIIVARKSMKCQHLTFKVIQSRPTEALSGVTIKIISNRIE